MTPLAPLKGGKADRFCERLREEFSVSIFSTRAKAIHTALAFIYGRGGLTTDRFAAGFTDRHGGLSLRVMEVEWPSPHPLSPLAFASFAVYFL